MNDTSPNMVTASSATTEIRSWLDVFILGLIEEITEFLPISSTGHMLLVKEFLHYKPNDLFLAVIQCGAVFAVIFAFTERLTQIFGGLNLRENREFLLKLALAFLITAIGGVILKSLNFQLPKNALPVALATGIGGLLILWIEAGIRDKKLSADISWKVAIAIGAAQILAVIFPGRSRSGTTIMLALILGVGRKAATEFSFILGVPTLLAAAALKIFEASQENTPSFDWPLLSFGTTVAAIAAFLAVNWLLRYIQSHTFTGFGWYRVGLAILMRIFLASGGGTADESKPDRSPSQPAYKTEELSARGQGNRI